MAEYKPLSIHDAVDLAAIVNAAIHTSHVTWALDDGRIVEGTARSIGDENGNFASERDDIRGCFLRVTTSMGFEAFLPMADVLDKVRHGLFVVGD